MKLARYSLWTVAALLLSLPGFAQPTPGVTQGLAKDHPKKRNLPVHMSATLTNSLGSGTFISGAADNPYFATNLALTPSFSWKDFSANASFNADLEWTQSDSTTYANQLVYSDIGFRFAYSGLKFSEQNISTSFNAGFDLPIALVSRHAGKLTGLVAGANITYAIPDLDLNLGANAGAGYNLFIPGFAASACDAEVVGAETCIGRDDSERANYAFGRIPRGLSLRGGVNLGWKFAEEWSLSTSASLIQSFSIYNAPNDRFTSKNARGGFGSSELLNANIGVSYRPLKWLSASAGISHFDTLRSSNAQGVRVPFFDALLGAPARNGTNAYLATTFTY